LEIKAFKIQQILKPLREIIIVIIIIIFIIGIATFMLGIYIYIQYLKQAMFPGCILLQLFCSYNSLYFPY